MYVTHLYVVGSYCMLCQPMVNCLTVGLFYKNHKNHKVANIQVQYTELTLFQTWSPCKGKKDTIKAYGYNPLIVDLLLHTSMKCQTSKQVSF